MSSIRVGNKDYSADIMGDSYEFLIKKFADLSKKNAGEFYTPRTIVKLMVNLLDPQPGETVYDPACGTGGTDSIGRFLFFSTICTFIQELGKILVFRDGGDLFRRDRLTDIYIRFLSTLIESLCRNTQGTYLPADIP